MRGEVDTATIQAVLSVSVVAVASIGITEAAIGIVGADTIEADDTDTDAVVTASGMQWHGEPSLHK